MDKNLIKNMEFSKAIGLGSMVAYQDGQVVSRTLAQGRPLSITLFAFDSGEEISSHASSGDAMVYILEGTARITIGQDEHTVRTGEAILMPKNVNHALYATERFKMLLVVVFSLD
jgi:quercetin dioxygenase-like cupin family protein